MGNTLTDFLPWWQMVIISMVLPLMIVAAVLVFAWPTARIAPRDLPVRLVGASPASQEMVAGLTRSEPGAFDFQLYPDGRRRDRRSWTVRFTAPS